MNPREFDAYLAQTAALGDWLAALPADDFTRPSVLPGCATAWIASTSRCDVMHVWLVTIGKVWDSQ